MRFVFIVWLGLASIGWAVDEDGKKGATGSANTSMTFEVWKSNLDSLVIQMMSESDLRAFFKDSMALAAEEPTENNPILRTVVIEKHASNS